MAEAKFGWRGETRTLMWPITLSTRYKLEEIHASVVTPQRFELQLSGPKPLVLPLDERVIKLEGTDSNRRTRKGADLQSAGFNHSPTFQ